jgi:NAD-dependent deacetylase
MERKKIVVLTGAGMSAESGIQTFRDAGGLWEGHKVEDVASPSGWKRNKELVLNFYNLRRRDVLKAQPNAAHKALADLEQHYKVTIITQNVDDLHERAGSTHVLHLHGEILKVRSTLYPHLIYDWKEDLKLGDTCEKGAQLRPHIVWFEEEVPMISVAQKITEQADILLIIGTSLVVYPAAGLLHYARTDCQKYLINPDETNAPRIANLKFIFEKATRGVPFVVQELLTS